MERILGVILAGGNSRRFGTDKAFASLGGRTLIARTIARARPQVDHVVLAVGRDPKPYAGLDHELILDAGDGADPVQQGPLAGILAGLTYGETRGFAHVVSYACDTPFFPPNLVSTLVTSVPGSQTDCVVAMHNGEPHRIFCLWRVACRARLETAFAGGLRKMEHVAEALALAHAEFRSSDEAPFGDPFFNINSPEDLGKAEHYLNNASALFKV
ncbi:MAG: molybdenum cofactor guanylyltransferase [Rhodospirillaceae bacterium]|nr:molybdenum cofactor guanylyltransferase [Rhodospirillaceae bacterium]